MKKRLIVGISGATGAVYPVRLLEVLQSVEEIETHLILSDAAKTTIRLETDYTLESIERLADYTHETSNLAAPMSSGSWRNLGMIVSPCSIKTLSGIAHSYNENLLIRSADVTLKERRPLVLMVRESPLHQGHLKLMLQATEMGARIVPPMPSFYTRPKTIDDIINQSVGRLLDIFEIEVPGLLKRWSGNLGHLERSIESTEMRSERILI